MPMALAGDLLQITATKLPNNRIAIKVMPLTAAQPPNNRNEVAY